MRPEHETATPERPHGDPLTEEALPGQEQPAPSPAPAVPAGEPEAPVAPPSPGTPDPEAPEELAVPAPGAAGDPGAEGEAGSGDGSRLEHEAQVAQDLEELAARARKADEYLELAQRTKADFENYRRRAARDAAAAQERGVAKLARELLPAVDNLDRALEAAEAEGGGNGADSLVSGIKLVHADVISALSRAGIERYSPQGEAFDPQHHEAVAQQPVEGAEPGTIVEVFQRGYRIGENILRPARVMVAG